ncbi:MAG: hypothetical protein ACYS74_10235, partial [Planctomycetota bacterium]
MAEQEEQPQPDNEAGTGTATEERPADAEIEDQVLSDQETDEESTHAKYERIKKGNLYLTDLQKLTVAELHDLAKKEDITEYSAL